MALIPWKSREAWSDPFRELEQIQNTMNRLFDVSLGRHTGKELMAWDTEWDPAVDVYDSKDAIVVKADLPGVNKEDIDISVLNDTLVIKGEKKQEKEVKEKGSIRSERFYGSFQRAITLPGGVDTGKVTAAYKNGVLELTLPKKEDAKPKQIKVDVK
jgi:Molecular chaperone (small heat shock protein)